MNVGLLEEMGPNDYVPTLNWLLTHHWLIILRHGQIMNSAEVPPKWCLVGESGNPPKCREFRCFHVRSKTISQAPRGFFSFLPKRFSRRISRLEAPKPRRYFSFAFPTVAACSWGISPELFLQNEGNKTNNGFFVGEMFIWVFPQIGIPQNGWFIMENRIKIDDLGVPLFLETPKCSSRWCFQTLFKHVFNLHPK